jgi:hypothetical protein
MLMKKIILKNKNYIILIYLYIKKHFKKHQLDTPNTL